jgi:hypothetical protein
LRRIGSQKERPLAIAHPSVVIASSGMLTGGASIGYAKILLEWESAASKDNNRIRKDNAPANFAVLRHISVNTKRCGSIDHLSIKTSNHRLILAKIHSFVDQLKTIWRDTEFTSKGIVHRTHQKY